MWVCVHVCSCILGDGVCVCAMENKQEICSLWNNKGHQHSITSESLLAIYNALHYITIPLACRHLHIAVTSLLRLLIINGSHMLPGAPYYRIITATQKAKKNGNYVDTKWSTKPIKGSAVIDSVSQPRWLNEYHLHTRVLADKHLQAEAEFAGMLSSKIQYMHLFIYQNNLAFTLTKHRLITAL